MGQHKVNVPGTFRTKRISFHRLTPLEREVPGTLPRTHPTLKWYLTS